MTKEELAIIPYQELKAMFIVDALRKGSKEIALPNSMRVTTDIKKNPPTKW